MNEAQVRQWVREGLIGDYDAALARLVGEIDRRAGRAVDDSVALAAALTSMRTRGGDVCLPLDEVAGTYWAEAGVARPEVAAWRAALAASAAVTLDGAEPRPLVLDAAGRLYLHRYWSYERSLAHDIAGLAADPVEVDRDGIRGAIDRWFGPPPPAPDAQRIAAAVCAARRLAVISGGPGTGKTTTVARVLGVLRDLHGPAYRVLLAAPTGKAAARLQSSIVTAMDRLGIDMPPGAVQTVHRMLGPIPRSVRFRHDADRPLPADCVVVDEASMVDLALAAKLLRALGPRTRLILLGDPGQLASVEAGAVLASLCAGAHGFSPASARLIAEVTGCQPRSDPDASSLADCVAILDRSHRFDATGAIAALAAGVRGGDAVGVAAIVARGGAALRRVPDVAAAVVDAMHDGFGPFVELVRAGGDAATLLQAADRFRALAGTRSGPLGSVQLNAAFERRLRRIVGANDRAEWYPGRLVIVTANDYALRLFNGDIGVALPEATRGSALRVHFPAARAGEPPRSLATVRMPPCESAFALTVHKSQGSEFDEVLVVMPGPESPLATRELLYTAVTRAVSRVMLAASDEAIRVAVTRTQARRSGLADALWARPG